MFGREWKCEVERNDGEEREETRGLRGDGNLGVKKKDSKLEREYSQKGKQNEIVHGIF